MSIQPARSHPKTFKAPLWFVFTLAALALGSVWLLLSVTNGWVGVGDDSVVYLAAAQNFLDGNGLSWVSGSDIVKPLTHFPPLYPLLLAGGEILLEDGLSFARFINAFSLAGIVFLIGLAAARVAGRTMYGILAAMIVLASPILLQEMVFAMSEPIYLLLSLAGILLLARYVASGRLLTLAIAGGLLGMALLARYIGWSLLPVAFAAVWLESRIFDRRTAGRALFVLVVVALPTVIWMVRGFLLTESTTNRVFAWHPITQPQLKRFAAGFWKWLFSSNFDATALYAVAAFALVITGLMILILLRRVRSVGSWSRVMNSIEPLTLLVGIYSFSYLVFLLASISLFDASTPINQRILLPLYINFLLLLFGVTPYFEARLENIERAQYIPALALFVLLISYAARSTTLYNDLRLNRSGYLAAAWYKSDVLMGLAEVPLEAILYTNDPQALYFLSGRSSLSVPVAIDTVIQEERDDYGDLLLAMQREIRDQCGALVLFNSVRLQTQYGPEEAIASGLEISFFDPSVRIYRSPEALCLSPEG